MLNKPSDANKVNEPTPDLANALDALRAEMAARKRVEEELKRYRDRLEELVKEQSAERVTIKEKTEATNHAKNVFLASMGHEMYTPLNAILGYAQILRRDKQLSERQIVGLNAIQQSGEHLLTLITDMLDLSKFEEGKLALYTDAVNFSNFLQIIANIARLKAEQKNLSFVYDASPDLPKTVLADEKRLRRVLLSLLDSAIKFTDRGQVSLRVKRLSDSGTTTKIHFEILDTSVGASQKSMQPPAASSAIKFTQTESKAQSWANTGLGFTISRPIVQLMGGDMQTESTPGHGNRVWFELSLPIKIDTMSSPQEETASKLQETVSSLIAPPYEEMQILYVLALAGNMRDIRQWADHLASLGEQYRPFADKLKHLAKEYQSQVILDMVEEYMRGN
ncbi:MAG: ATP-binding protein [Pseudomonadota bacterium]